MLPYLLWLGQDAYWHRNVALGGRATVGFGEWERCEASIRGDWSGSVLPGESCPAYPLDGEGEEPCL